jgi:hypothetical protein
MYIGAMILNLPSPDVSGVTERGSKDWLSNAIIGRQERTATLLGGCGSVASRTRFFFLHSKHSRLLRFSLMSSALPISEQLALFRQLVRGAQTIRYTNISAWVLLIWDHRKFGTADAADSMLALTLYSIPVISLEQEVRIINAGITRIN